MATKNYIRGKRYRTNAEYFNIEMRNVNYINKCPKLAQELLVFH